MGQAEVRPRKRRRPPHRRKTVRWDAREVDALVAGVRIHGVGKWAAILRHSPVFNGVRTSVDLKDKWRNLTSHTRSGATSAALASALDPTRSTSSSPIPSPQLFDNSFSSHLQQQQISSSSIDQQNQTDPTTLSPNLQNQSITDGPLTMSPASDADFQNRSNDTIPQTQNSDALLPDQFLKDMKARQAQAILRNNKNTSYQLAQTDYSKTQSPFPNDGNIPNTNMNHLHRPASESSLSPELVAFPHEINQKKHNTSNGSIQIGCQTSFPFQTSYGSNKHGNYLSSHNPSYTTPTQTLPNPMIRQSSAAHEIFNQSIQNSAAALSCWRQIGYDPNMYGVSSAAMPNVGPSHYNPYLLSRNTSGYMYPGQEEDDDDDDDEDDETHKIHQYRQGYPPLFSNSLMDYNMNYSLIHPYAQPSSGQSSGIQTSSGQVSISQPIPVHVSTSQPANDSTGSGHVSHLNQESEDHGNEKGSINHTSGIKNKNNMLETGETLNNNNDESTKQNMTTSEDGIHVPTPTAHSDSK